VAKRRLGRHVEHDPRSWNYPAPRARELKSVLHRRRGRIFTQPYDTGACTGFAAAGLLMTEPFYRLDRELTDIDALVLYAHATHLDAYAGAYPPDDTGSSGLAVMKAARAAGYVQSFGHAFGLQHALYALMLAPVITGVNWYPSFDHPRHGVVHKAGHPRGGHEFLVVGMNVEDEMIRACNSWGPDWGDHGYFEFSFRVWDELLALNGDVTTVLA